MRAERADVFLGQSGINQVLAACSAGSHGKYAKSIDAKALFLLSSGAEGSIGFQLQRKGFMVMVPRSASTRKFDLPLASCRAKKPSGATGICAYVSGSTTSILSWSFGPSRQNRSWTPDGGRVAVLRGNGLGSQKLPLVAFEWQIGSGQSGVSGGAVLCGGCHWGGCSIYRGAE